MGIGVAGIAVAVGIGGVAVSSVWESIAVCTVECISISLSLDQGNSSQTSNSLRKFLREKPKYFL